MVTALCCPLGLIETAYAKCIDLSDSKVSGLCDEGKFFITVCERQINFLLGYIKRAVT